MPSERPRRLSYFEAVMHGGHRKITLSSEIKDCFEYFEDHSPRELGSQKISEIHGNGITLKRVSQGKGFLVEIRGDTHIVGKDKIPKVTQEVIVRKIWNITFPYREHINKKLRKP